MKNMQWGHFVAPIVLALGVVVFGPRVATAQTKTPDKTTEKAAEKPKLVDINTATEAELEQVTGVGPAFAKKIIANRPYANVAELSKSGIPANRLSKIEPLVTVTAPTHTTTTKVGKTTVAKSTEKTATGTTVSGGATTVGAVKPAGLVNINTATEAQLEVVNGVGPAYAKKIIANRPYAAVADLSKTGIPANRLAKIEPLVTVASPTVTTVKTGTSSVKVGDKPATDAKSVVKTDGKTDTKSDSKTDATTKSTRTKVEAQTPPKKGMVWANKNSKIYHMEGDNWYGRTKNGEWMTEEDAVKAGYRHTK